MMSETERKHDRLRHIGELTSRITHDMRNPLTVIINYTTMVKKNSKNKLDKKSLDQLSLIESEARKMHHLIEDVLNYVKLAPLKLEEHSLHTILKGVLEKTELPHNTQINLPNKNPMIPCDLEKLEVVFNNLITNALHAIDENGEITIKTTTTKDDIIIEFEDTGPGIAEKDLDKVFEPLFTTKEYGTGLGLASCKNIIERHRGEINVTNNPTKFIIRLPRKSN